jgi:hypothetical protein
MPRPYRGTLRPPRASVGSRTCFESEKSDHVIHKTIDRFPYYSDPPMSYFRSNEYTQLIQTLDEHQPADSVSQALQSVIESKRVLTNSVLKACQEGRLDVLHLLRDELTLLHLNTGLDMACWKGHVDVARFLIAQGATNFNVGFERACKNGHIHILSLMAEFGATRFIDGLRIAVEIGHASVIYELATKHKVPLGPYTTPVLVIAFKEQHAQLTQLVLDQLDAQHVQDVRLYYVIQARDFKTARSLIEKGLRPNDCDLMEAARHCDVELLHFMLQGEISDRDIGLQWAFTEASVRGDLVCVHLLSTYFLPDYNRGLEAACSGGHLEMVQFMLAAGATRLKEAFEAACAYSHLSVVQLIMKQGYHDHNKGIHLSLTGPSEIDTVARYLLSLGGDRQCVLDAVKKRYQPASYRHYVISVECGLAPNGSDEWNLCHSDLVRLVSLKLSKGATWIDFGCEQHRVDRYLTWRQAALQTITSLLDPDTSSVILTFI